MEETLANAKLATELALVEPVRPFVSQYPEGAGTQHALSPEQPFQNTCCVTMTCVLVAGQTLMIKEYHMDCVTDMDCINYC